MTEQPSYQQQPQPPKKRRKWPWIVGGVVLLLIIIAVASGGSSSSRSNTAASSPAPTTGAATSSAPGSTTAAAVAPQVLLQQTGNGSKDTASFTAKGNWDIAYTYDCTGFAGGTGNFAVIPKGTDNNPSFANSGINELGAKGNDVAHEHHGGTYYLSVLSECPWTLKVTG